MSTVTTTTTVAHPQQRCAECKGDGELRVEVRDCGHSGVCPCGSTERVEPCPTCGGDGGATCTDCGGSILEGQDRGPGEDPQCSDCQAAEVEAVRLRAVALTVLHDAELTRRAFGLQPHELVVRASIGDVNERVLRALVGAPVAFETGGGAWGTVSGTDRCVTAWGRP
jgi:hypothetical protein